MVFIFSKPSSIAAALFKEEATLRASPSLRRERRSVASYSLPSDDAMCLSQQPPQPPPSLPQTEREPSKKTPNPISPARALALLHSYHYCEKGSSEFRESLRTISVRHAYYSEEVQSRTYFKQVCAIKPSTLSYCIDQSVNHRRSPLPASHLPNITPPVSAVFPPYQPKLPVDQKTFTEQMDERMKYTWLRGFSPERGDLEQKQRSDARKRKQKPKTEGYLDYARMALITKLKESVDSRRLRALGVEGPIEQDGQGNGTPVGKESDDQVEAAQTTVAPAKTLEECMQEFQIIDAPEDRERRRRKRQERKAQLKKAKQERQLAETRTETRNMGTNNEVKIVSMEVDVSQVLNQESRNLRGKLLAFMGGRKRSGDRKYVPKSENAYTI